MCPLVAAPNAQRLHGARRLQALRSQAGLRDGAGLAWLAGDTRAGLWKEGDSSMSSDYYLGWVEHHKHEDEDGRWWRVDNDIPTDGPYATEAELDAVLWDQALAGDAVPSAP